MNKTIKLYDFIQAIKKGKTKSEDPYYQGYNIGFNNALLFIENHIRHAIEEEFNQACKNYWNIKYKDE